MKTEFFNDTKGPRDCLPGKPYLGSSSQNILKIWPHWLSFRVWAVPCSSHFKVSTYYTLVGNAASSHPCFIILLTFQISTPISLSQEKLAVALIFLRRICEHKHLRAYPRPGVCNMIFNPSVIWSGVRTIIYSLLYRTMLEVEPHVLLVNNEECFLFLQSK